MKLSIMASERRLESEYDYTNIHPDKMDLVMNNEGHICFSHYKISTHAMQRYMERAGGDAGNLVIDLLKCWVVNPDQKSLSRAVRCSAIKAEEKGCYSLSNGDLLFHVMPCDAYHMIITTIKLAVFYSYSPRKRWRRLSSDVRRCVPSKTVMQLDNHGSASL